MFCLFFFLIFLFQILCSGDTDAVIPVTSTRYSIDALKLPTVTPWHAWYDDNGEVGLLSPQPIIESVKHKHMVLNL